VLLYISHLRPVAAAFSFTPCAAEAVVTILIVSVSEVASPCADPAAVIAAVTPYFKSPERVVVPETLKDTAVVFPDASTVNVEPFTSIPPSREERPSIVNVPEVSMLPVPSATVNAPSTSIPPSKEARPEASMVVATVASPSSVDCH